MKHALPDQSAVRDYFCHPQALVDPGVKVGARTRIWAFAHVIGNAVIGEDCNICDHTFVEGAVVIGNRVTLKCGVYLWDGVQVEDDVFIGPNATFTNDMRPRSRHHEIGYPTTLLKRGCSIGAHAVILPGITIGSWVLIGAGSVVTRDVPDHAQVFGNPARWKSWVCQCSQKLTFEDGRTALCGCGRSFRLEDGVVRAI